MATACHHNYFSWLHVGKFWQGKKLVNCELFAKNFLTNIHRYTVKA